MAAAKIVLDCYVHERLAKFASTKHGSHGLNLGTYNWDWILQLDVYRLEGRPDGEPRMPGGERCRQAVCGRTARTV